MDGYGDSFSKIRPDEADENDADEEEAEFVVLKKKTGLKKTLSDEEIENV